jgi:UDP-glucose 4-epimerase
MPCHPARPDRAIVVLYLRELKGLDIVVTGGAGFIGSNLAEHLAKDNKVTIIDNMHTGNAENIKGILANGATLIQDDVRNIGSYSIKPDAVFHLGMYSSTPMYGANRRLVAEVVDGAIAICEFCVQKGAKLVIASSSSIYNGHRPPHNEEMVPFVTDFYTEARISVERLAELYGKLDGLNAVAVRFFSVYGKNEKYKGKYANLVSQFMWAAQKGESPVIYGDGSQTRDFTYVDDTVRALELSASKDFDKFEIFNAGRGRAYTINEMVAILGKQMGKEIKPTYITNPLKNYVEYTQADTRKATEKLGFTAQYSLDDGIAALLKYYSGKS